VTATRSAITPQRALDWLATAPRVDLAAGAILLTQVLNLHHDRLAQLALALVAVPVLLQPRLRHNPWIWWALALLIAMRIAPDFVLLDDHVVASTYAVALVGAGLAARDREWVLARSAALLIGSIFAFATFWKLTSGQFVDSRFFRFTLVFDDRFDHLWPLTGQEAADAATSIERAEEAMAAGPGAEAVIAEGPRNVLAATVITWWTIAIEAAVAALFLWPRPRPEGSRHVALMVFLVTTYVVVPVAGFGTLLAALGAVTTDDPRWRLRYTTAFAVLLVWTPVWRAVLG
jgi:hypothetical protein